MTHQHDRSIFDYAKEQLLNYGRSIIPLIGKRPALDWKKYQTQRQTLGELAVWFGHGSTYNYAIVCGAISDTVVIDCDSRKEAIWWWQNRPRSLECVASGRGFHFYYRFAPTGNKTGVLGRKIDVRGTGGYIVGPGSIHPQTGKPYFKLSLDGVRTENATFNPAWIKREATHDAFSTHDKINDPIGYIRSIRAIAGAGGHNATYRAACKLRQGGLSEAEALAALIEWNECNAEPPWTLRELAHKVTDAYRR